MRLLSTMMPHASAEFLMNPTHRLSLTLSVPTAEFLMGELEATKRQLRQTTQQLTNHQQQL